MQIVCCQTSKSVDDKAATFARITELLSAAPPPGGAMVVLPETFATLGSPDMAAIAADDDSASEAFLAETAKCMGVYMVGGVVSRGSAKAGRNDLLVLRGIEPEGAERTAAGKPKGRHEPLSPMRKRLRFRASVPSL